MVSGIVESQSSPIDDVKMIVVSGVIGSRMNAAMAADLRT